MKVLSSALLSFLLLTSCSHKEKSVNDAGQVSYVPVMVLDNQVTQDSIARSSAAALEGRVMTNADIPTPLSNVQLTVFKDEKGKSKQVTQLSTDSGGHFQVTQKLSAGRYEIRITDHRYTGKLNVTLDSAPALNLVVTATKK
jgi:5-hydroxyisourate hydrolase-like protein (transthyretin family)